MDLKLSGSGIVPAGEYETVALSGSAKISGDIKCSAFSAAGSLKGEAVECLGNMKISGSSKFTKGISAKDLTVSGSFSCGGIECENLSVKGASMIDGEMFAAESAVLQGAIACNGLLSAERVSIVFGGKTAISAIKGGSVSMTKKRLAPFAENVHVAGSVEADESSLTYVNCPRVSGKRVTIGKGCEIDLVQYSETIDISANAYVKKIEKI